MADELDRLAKTEQLDAYLVEMEERLGPVSADEASKAVEWATAFDRPPVVGDLTPVRSPSP